MLLTSAMNHANRVPNRGNAESPIYSYQKEHQTNLAAKIQRKISALFRAQSVFFHYDEMWIKNATQEQDETNHIERCAIVANPLSVS